MSSFTRPLRLEYRDDARFVLTEAFVYHAGREDSGYSWTVPAGFVTDFASTPRWLWPVFPPTGRWGKAAVLHDFLYSKIAEGWISRVEADATFLEAMRVLKVPRWRRWTMYLAVRVCGGLHLKLTSRQQT